MTAPTLIDRLLAWAAYLDMFHWDSRGRRVPVQLMQEAALELARLESQLEAAGPSKAAEVKHGCHCDLENMPDGYQPDDCVLEYGDHESCVHARQLYREGKDKTACQYWRPIKTPERVRGFIGDR